MELTYTNESGGKLTLRQAKPFFLTKLDGAGSVRQTVNTFQAPQQDGAFFISSALDMRNITLEGTIAAGTPNKAYEYRRQFLKIFTPNVNEHERQFMCSSTSLRSKPQGTLTYRNRQIACVVEEAGFTASGRERAPGFFVSLLCPSPFFEALSEVRAELARWTPLFHFMLEIPDGGVEFGSRQPSQIITVENSGDVSCGCRIVFRALGEVENPELMNVSTGEYVRLNTVMTAGEEIRVYTHFAGKRVVRLQSGEEVSVFSLLDTGSTFLQLSPGTTTLRYDAAAGKELLEVSLYYRPQYLGV
jgi:hypothetical protein